MANAGAWRVRAESARGEGQAIDFARLARGVADGVWSEADEVRGPMDAAFRSIGDHPDIEEFVPRRPLFRSRPVQEAEMDMTPMIDVTFQLLIFFMITATFVTQKTLDMPKADADREKTPPRATMAQIRQENIILKATRDGRITVDDQPTELGQLESVLREAGRSRDNVELAMDVDAEVEHAAVVAILDAAAGAQIQKVHLLSRGPPKP